MTLSHRDRVLAALRHTETDRVPIDFGAGIATTAYHTAYRRLTAYLGVEQGSATAARRSRTVIPDEEVLERFEIDTRYLGLGAYDGRGHDLDEDRFVDEWDTTWEKRDTHPYINVDGPFYNKKPRIEDLESFDWPDPDNPGYYRGLRERAEAAHATGCAVVLNLPVGIVHQGQFMRGYGDWLKDLIRSPDYACRMMDIIADVWVRVVNNALDLVEDQVDVVFFGDDMATQQTTLFSPRAYRELVKPRHARMFAALKARDVKIAFHSCGSTVSLFDDFVELGIDAVNPVQVSAANMDPARLKAQYGERLSFWGGIDTQKVLPFGSVAEVRAEVRRMIDVMGKGGGFVLASVHNIQPDVPPENVVAMFEEAASYRGPGRG